MIIIIATNIIRVCVVLLLKCYTKKNTNLYKDIAYIGAGHITTHISI